MICCAAAAATCCLAVRLRRRKRLALALALISAGLAAYHYWPCPAGALMCHDHRKDAHAQTE